MSRIQVTLWKKGSNVVQHAWNMDHRIDFKQAKVIDKGNFRQRWTLESWHTTATENADYIILNHSQNNILFF